MSMLPHGETCPVDLDYPELQPVRLDLDSIVGRGSRLRRERRMVRAGTLILACSALVGGFTLAHHRPAGWFGVSSGPAAGSGGTLIPSLVAGHPPVGGKPALLSRWPQGWGTFAWATRQGDVCWATIEVPVHPGIVEDECPGWTRADVPSAGGRRLSPLLPGVFPIEDGVTDSRPDGAGDRVPEFGLVTPLAVRVTLTFLGHAFSARVVQVPVRGGGTVGVFMAWLTLPAGVSGYGSADISSEVAYDAGGHIIARHGPWS